MIVNTPEKRRVELLAPAGNREKMEVAFHYGADAVYLGGQKFGLRAFAGNFTEDSLGDAVIFAHSLGKKVFVTLNIFPRNSDFAPMPEYIRHLEKIGVDAVIVSDLGVFSLVREESDLPIHISTQANTMNWRTAREWHRMGAERVILARELSLEEISEIKQRVPELALEVFIHGAICVSFSGRCLLSQYMTGRDANHGTCTHPCRWQYKLIEEKRPDEELPIAEDDFGTYILNSKDLKTLGILNQIIDAGVDSLKIEGRMKGLYYSALSTSIYRRAISLYENNEEYLPPENWHEELESFNHRPYFSGFFIKDDNIRSQHNNDYGYSERHKFTGIVEGPAGDNRYVVLVKNQMRAGKIEVISPGKEPLSLNINTFVHTKNGEEVTVVNPNSHVTIKSPVPLNPMDMLRVEAPKRR